MTFSSRLGGLEQLHGNISSRQNRIAAAQKRVPTLPGRNFLHVIGRYNLWWIITFPASQQNGTEFHPSQLGFVMTTKDFLKVVAWNHFAKAAITGTFRRATYDSTTKKVSKIKIFHSSQFLSSVVKIYDCNCPK